MEHIIPALPCCPFCGLAGRSRVYVCNDGDEFVLYECAECGSALRYLDRRDEWRTLVRADCRAVLDRMAASARLHGFNARVRSVRADEGAVGYVIVAEKHEKSKRER